jgi:hypothetical protein
MLITMVGTGPLVVVLANPATDQFFNWSANWWEGTFNPARHARPMQPMELPGSIFNAVLWAIVPDNLMVYPAAALVLSATATVPATYTVVQAWPGISGR